MELESALLIVPPRPVQAFSYPLREEHDPESFAKVPAHFTFFYPFIPASLADEEESKLRGVCAQFDPFEVTLERFGYFENAVFLEPSDPEPFIALYRAFAEIYPEYAKDDYHPHLTLGKGEDVSKIPLPDPPSLVFTVDKVQLYVGAPKDTVAPYVPRLKVPLG